jgi:hypothetical protein
LGIKLFVFLIFTNLLFAQSYLYFTQDEMNYIEKTKGKIPKNRIGDYEKFMRHIKNHPKSQQLKEVNLYLNQLLPQHDKITRKKEDYWATPKEFLISGFGDCEDYAIIKYFSLLRLGFDEKKLFMTVVKVKHSRGRHMVLSYFRDKKKYPLILDNLSFRMLPLNKRTDLKAEFFLNSTGVYKPAKDHHIKKIARSFKKYKNLIKRIDKESCI